MQMKSIDNHAWSWAIGSLLVAFGFGCGRDAPQRTCQANADCRGERRCLEGLCTSPEAAADAQRADADDLTPEVGSDVDEDEPDGANDVDDGRSLDSTCEPCDPWTRSTPGPECQCKPIECSDASECDGFACVDGTCQACESEQQCEEGQRCDTSGTFGRCVPDPCESDADCEAREQCNDDGRCINRDECLVDDDCGNQEKCFNGRCTYSPACERNADCREGLECIGGRCYEEVCRGNDDCQDGRICNAGECVEPTTSATQCYVSTSSQTIAEDERVQLEAFATDEDGNGVPAEFDWSSSSPSVADIGPDGEFIVGGSSSGTTQVTARLADGSVSCQGAAEFRNLGSVSGQQLRFVVTDARSRDPVSGAKVVVETSNGQNASTTTDNSGVATLPNPGQGAYTVSVFASDYNYLTIQGVNTNDVRLPLVGKEGSGAVAGFKGQFDTSRIHTSGDVTLGLAGSSITGGLLELDLKQLLGNPFVQEVQTPAGNQSIPLSGGLVTYGQVAGFDLDLKRTYYATAPGGTRLGWGLTGKVSGLRLFQLLRQGDNTLAQLLPLFNRFDHAVRPIAGLQTRSRIQDTNDIDGDDNTSEMVPDYQNFQSVSMQPSVRQNLVTEVSISNFPTLRTGETELAMLVGGNVLPSSGLVPLGISATTDENGDGFPDAQRLSMAPPHGPLTKGRYAGTAIAFRTDGFEAGSGGFELPDDMSVALWSKQSLPQKISLGTFPEATTGQINTNSRTIDLSADAGPIYRARFVGTNRSWEVWSVGPAGSMGQYQHTMEIPEVSNRRDLFTQADKVLVDAIQASVTIDDLVKSTGIGLRDLGLVATAFNRTKLQ